MDESLAWKIVYVAVIFSLLVLGIAYYFISPRESTFFSEEKIQKIAEFKHTRIEGRKEGKKLWEFSAQEGWVEKGGEVTHLTNISRGKIYQGGILSVSGLTAPRAMVYRSSEIVEAFGQSEKKVRASLDLEKFSAQTKETTKWTKMTADYIKLVPTEKKSEISGNVILSLKDTIIYADKINVDHEKKIANISEKVSIKRRDGILRADTVEYLGEAEQMNAFGNLNLALRENRIKTRVKSNQGILFLDTFKDISLSGSIEVTQGKKHSIANEGVYSRRQKGLFLKGNTLTILEKGKALLDEESSKDIHRPDVENILREKTLVRANEFFFSTKTGDARATGSVEVTQKGREAKSDSAIFDDAKDTLTLTGNVYMKKGEDWIHCKKVVISIKKETFEAFGVTEAKFEL